MSDDEEQVLMTLNNSNLEFIPEESKLLSHLVFKIVNTLGDDSIALANFTFQFLGTIEMMIHVLSITLSIKSGEEYHLVGSGSSEDDPRVLKIEEWAPNVPLPLGDNLLDRLRIVVKIEGHVDLGRIVFKADVVPFPEAFLVGEPKLKRKLGQSTIRFKGGKIQEVENPVQVFGVKTEKKVSLDYWWTPCASNPSTRRIERQLV